MSKKFKLNRESTLETAKGLQYLKQEYGDQEGIHKIQLKRNQAGQITARTYTTNHKKQTEINVAKQKERQEVERILALEQRRMRMRAQEMMRQYPSVDRNAINNIVAQSNALTAQGQTVTGLRNRYQDFNLSLKEIESNTKRVTANTNTMAGAFQNAMIFFGRLR